MVASHPPQEASSEQELHAKKSKVKIWTNYTPTPTYPKTIDNKNLAGKAWTVTVGSQKPNFVNHVDWGSLMPLLKYQGDTNLCWAYLTTTCAEVLYFIEAGERISVNITSMIESAKDTMLPDDTNLPEGGFEGKEGLFFLGEVKKLLGEQVMKHALDFGPICAILDWHPCMLSFVKETIVPPMPYGIALCTEYACENEGKAVIKRCHLCGYGYGLHQVCIAGYGNSSTGKKYWIVHDSAFGKIRVEGGRTLLALGVEHA
ncbi:hypothetical protein EV1_014373 [Malus domestica]